MSAHERLRNKMESSNLPFQNKQHDSLRCGLPTLKEDALPKHPVEQIQLNAKEQAQASKHQMLRDVYGEALPLRMHLTEQILSRFQRLPGPLPSSMLGLEAFTGALDEFGFESYLGLPEHSEQLPVDVHMQMEMKLRLSREQQTRGLF